MTAEIKAKRTEHEKYGVKAKALLSEYPNGFPNQERENEFDGYLEKMESLATEIKGAETAEERKAALERHDAFQNAPQRKIPHGINGDDDDRKNLLGAGWEIKAGIVYAPTSSGKPQPMFGEDVLFGDIPIDDPLQAEYFQKTRAAFAPEYKAAYSRYLQLSVKYRSETMAMTMLSPSEQKALSEGSDTAGGFLVPPDVQAEVLSRTAQMSVFRQRASVRTTSRDKMEFPAVAPHATSGSIYSSGFVGTWVGETPAFTETDPAFQKFEINIRKIRVATKLSNDFVADAATNVLSFLATDGGRNMALVEESGFIAGDGGPYQPMGILNTGLTTFDVEGSTSNTISNTTSNAGSAPKIVAGTYTLPSQYAGNASWIMRRAIEGKVRGLVDGMGRPMWPALTGSGFAQAPADLVGAPVYNSDFMPTDGVDGNKVMLYGDLSNYIIAQRAQVTSTILRERFADTDQIGIILWERVGGGLWNTDSIRVGIV